jgi:hypothetical protein
LIATEAQKQRGEIAVRLKANISVAQSCCADSPVSLADGAFFIVVELNQVR